jgi:hypothetical protein
MVVECEAGRQKWTRAAKMKPLQRIIGQNGNEEISEDLRIESL